MLQNLTTILENSFYSLRSNYRTKKTVLYIRNLKIRKISKIISINLLKASSVKFLSTTH